MLLFPSVRVNQMGSQLLGHKNALWEAACFSNFKEHDSPGNVIIIGTRDRNREGSLVEEDPKMNIFFSRNILGPVLAGGQKYQYFWAPNPWSSP